MRIIIAVFSVSMWSGLAAAHDTVSTRNLTRTDSTATQRNGTVHALFDLASPSTGPFPSDWFTVRDSGNLTRRRVNLPQPDCRTHRSDCEDLTVINTLDGFNLQPRVSIPFDGAIDVTTVTSNTVFLISLGSTLREGEDDEDGECDGKDANGDCGRIVGINQVVWDTFSNTLHVETDELLNQDSRYAVIVTRGVRDQMGDPVEATEAFRRFRRTVRGEYRRALLQAIHAARQIGVREPDIATASLFTTQSATAILEKIRDQIKAGTPAPADFNLGPGGFRTVFARDTVTGITWNQQTGDNPDDPSSFTSVQFPLEYMDFVPGAVERIAFGKYLSPNYEVHPGEFIPPVATRIGTPTVQSWNEVYFDLYLPSGRKPANGWPVAIFGHGNNVHRHSSESMVSILASQGIATIAINAMGHGFGPYGTLTIDRTMGDPVTFLEGGRGIDQDGDGIIDPDEGFSAAAPWTIIFFTDGVRQTVADLMQLVRLIQMGIDVDGDGLPELDPSRVYYVGVSLGGNYGTPFLAVEPSVLTGVVDVAAGPIIENRQLSPPNRRVLGELLASREPSLINAPGITNLAGVNVNPPYFNENMPLRNGVPLAVRLADGTSWEIQSPVINTVEGAIAIQEMVKNAGWVGQPGNPVAYAPHVRKEPLAGVPAKSVIFQFARGDYNGNPHTTAILRAGELADRATFYRHDLAFAEEPRLPRNPHTFLSDWLLSPIYLEAEVCRGAQEHVARFFVSDGKEITHPKPARFFEVPIVPPLPEDLGYVH